MRAPRGPLRGARYARGRATHSKISILYRWSDPTYEKQPGAHTSVTVAQESNVKKKRSRTPPHEFERAPRPRPPAPHIPLQGLQMIQQ